MTHEFEVPAVLILEKNIDLWNISMGASIADRLFPPNSDKKALLILLVKNGLIYGELKYLDPHLSKIK